MNELSRLFEPVAIGNVVVRNRLAMLAMGTMIGDGPRVNEAIKAYYRARAKGGVGLIMVGTMPVSDVHEIHPNEIAIYDDQLVPGLRELARLIHAEGAKAFAQLLVYKHWRAIPEEPMVELGPSDVKIMPSYAPRPATLDEIHLIQSYVINAARRAREAGFDGVEIHAATGELISQFLAPFTNHRTDEYGGSLENRARFLSEIITGIRRKVGPDFVITVKMGGDDFIQGGCTLEDAKQIAQLLEKVGAHGLNIAVGWHQSPVPNAVSSVPQGAFVYLASAIKQVVGIPVITGYRITDPLMAARIIAEGKADLVGMARALLADPDLPNKARDGRLDDIRPCLACCRCIDEANLGRHIICSVNPVLGRETEYRVEPASTKKKVLVAGGGPAGIEAAIIAATRGHDVTLFEKSGRLGGQLLPASAPPFKTEINSFEQYLSRQVAKAGVKVKLGQELTADLVNELKPDAVIAATGAEPVIPAIPGVSDEKVVTANDVLSGSRVVGAKVAVVGGGMVGCETALFLAERGRKVTIVEMLERVATDVNPSNRWVVRQQLKKAEIELVTRAKAHEIVPQGVLAKVGEEIKLVEADTVVLAIGARASKRLAEQLEGKTTVLSVGDCIAPRLIRDAIIEGFQAGTRV